MTTPTKHCNRQRNGSTNRKPANCSTSTKERCRRTGQKAFLEQPKSIGKRISDYPKWSYLCRGDEPLKSKRNETDWKFKRRYACLARSCGRHQNELLYIRNIFHSSWKSTFRANKVCEMLHISKRTLQQYRDDGLIPFIKLERKILFRESDIIKVLEDNYQR